MTETVWPKENWGVRVRQINAQLPLKVAAESEEPPIGGDEHRVLGPGGHLLRKKREERGAIFM